MEDISTKKREIVDIVVNEKYIFEMDGYYRINKTKSQLRRTIYRIKNICQPIYEPYFRVVYSLNDDADHVKDIEIPRHGNSKKNTEIERPYIRTETTILKRQDTHLRINPFWSSVTFLYPLIYQGV